MKIYKKHSRVLNLIDEHFSIVVTFNEVHLDKAKNMEMISDYQNMDGNG